MKFRLAILAATMAALLTVCGVRTLARTGGVERRVSTASARSTTASQVAKLEQQVRTAPNDVEALSSLAAAYTRRARETGDPSFYTLADTAVKRALSREPDNVQAMIVAGGLALARHDFNGALMLGERAASFEPSIAASYGIITDANLELGRYDEAIAAAQAMADRHPDFASYSRISYIRELHGDIAGAITAMQQAVGAGSTVPQDAVWGRVLLANLELANGDIDGAAEQYERAAVQLPGDPAAEFGLARLAAARGDLSSAETHLRAAIARRPQPDYVIALGDLLSSQGRTREAEEQYATVRAIQQLFAANGGDADIELALFDADHNVDPQGTYQRAIAAYRRRGSVYAADTVAWAAYKAGRVADAEAYIALAQRIGTRDARLAYHAGVIARAAGDRETAARYLRDALERAPSLSLPDAAQARTILADIESAVSR
jgi:tetratricopeptide (TPR) repeat protein